MTGKHKVTKQVWTDHPDGYQVLAAAPGDEIPHERAVELGLVDEPKRAQTTVQPDPAVETAEVRRSKPGTARKKAAAKGKAADGDDDE